MPTTPATEPTTRARPMSRRGVEREAATAVRRDVRHGTPRFGTGRAHRAPRHAAGPRVIHTPVGRPVGAAHNRAMTATDARSAGLGRFLTLADIAEVLNISASQAYALVRIGELPAIKVGGNGHWRIERDVLETLHRRQVRGEPSPRPLAPGGVRRPARAVRRRSTASNRAVEADQHELASNGHEPDPARTARSRRGTPGSCSARSRWSRPTRSIVPCIRIAAGVRRSTADAAPAEVAQHEGRPRRAESDRSPARRRRRHGAARELVARWARMPTIAAIGTTQRRAPLAVAGSSPAIQSRPDRADARARRASPSRSTTRSGLAPRADEQRAQAVAQREAAEAQPLLLGEQVEVLGAELLLELALEVVEEVVPAHARDATQRQLGVTPVVVHRLDAVARHANRLMLRWITPEAGATRFTTDTVRGGPMRTATPSGGIEPHRRRSTAAESLHDRAISTQTGASSATSRRPTAALPDPRPLLENLTRCVIEILAGARELEQIARWVTDDVYRHLLKRVVLAARARQAKGSRRAADVLDRLDAPSASRATASSRRSSSCAAAPACARSPSGSRASTAAGARPRSTCSSGRCRRGGRRR